MRSLVRLSLKRSRPAGGGYRAHAVGAAVSCRSSTPMQLSHAPASSLSSATVVTPVVDTGAISGSAPAVVLVLPWPDWRLSPNRSSAIRKTVAAMKRAGGMKSRLAEEANWSGYAAGINQRGIIDPGTPIDAAYLFQPPDGRRFDVDNGHSALKHYLDGVMAGLGFNDYNIWDAHPARLAPSPDGEAKVWVFMWPCALSPFTPILRACAQTVGGELGWEALNGKKSRGRRVKMVDIPQLTEPGRGRE